jgi:hypothetical protein
MTLDLAILGDDGRPAATVSISVEAHRRLVVTAESLRLNLVSRLRDYYQDATFERSELPELLQELKRLSAAPLQHQEEEMRFIAELRELSIRAIAQERGLVALSD